MLPWSHPGRIRSEAAFAMLPGTCPIPAGNGLTNRHRLNRSGDRQLQAGAHPLDESWERRTGPAATPCKTARGLWASGTLSA
jgi:hypothetical protein